MRITQGTFSFLPDLSDEQITQQIDYCLGNGWAIGIEYTDDPHPRNTFWEMFGNPMFDLAGRGRRDARAATAAARPSRTTTSASRRSTRRTAPSRWCMSFIVNRPEDEPGFRLVRTEEARPHDALQHRELRGAAHGRRRALLSTRTDATHMPCNRHRPPTSASAARGIGRRAPCSTSSMPSWSAWRRSRAASATSPRCC